MTRTTTNADILESAYRHHSDSAAAHYNASHHSASLTASSEPSAYTHALLAVSHAAQARQAHIALGSPRHEESASFERLRDTLERLAAFH